MLTQVIGVTKLRDCTAGSGEEGGEGRKEAMPLLGPAALASKKGLPPAYGMPDP